MHVWSSVNFVISVFLKMGLCPILDSEHYFLKSLAAGGKSVGGFYCNFFGISILGFLNSLVSH